MTFQELGPGKSPLYEKFYINLFELNYALLLYADDKYPLIQSGAGLVQVLCMLLMYFRFLQEKPSGTMSSSSTSLSDNKDIHHTKSPL